MNGFDFVKKSQSYSNPDKNGIRYDRFGLGKWTADCIIKFGKSNNPKLVVLIKFPHVVLILQQCQKTTVTHGCKYAHFMAI